MEAALSAATIGHARALDALIERSTGSSHRRPVGDKPNNHGLMGSSGSYDLKLIELVTNMQDAVIERQALLKWGASEKVPYTDPQTAAADLLAPLGVARKDAVTVEFRESDPPTGRTKRLTAVFRDMGCGLTPSQLPTTVFQLGGSFKEDKLYLQGAFGLGGAMTYRNAQAVVVVTRRDPALLAPGESDLITVAVVTWNKLTKGSSASYLVGTPWNTAGDVALPWTCPAGDAPDFEPGTHVAVVSYGVEGLHRKYDGDAKSFGALVDTRLFRPVMPVRFTNNIARGRNINLRGLAGRLEDNVNPDRKQGTETLPFNVDGVTYHLPVHYWVFPEGEGGRKSFVAANHVVLFLSNGQVHHHWNPSEFRSKTSLKRLADRLLVTVDTDALPIDLRTSLFTADRNDLVRNDPALRLEESVRSFIDDWEPLKAENGRLIREALRGDDDRSTLDLSRRIGRAIAARLGFAVGGGLGRAGTDPGPGGSGGTNGGSSKKIELGEDPTYIDGPAEVRAEIGKTRSIPFVIDVVDEFFVQGRGQIMFECGHDGIGSREIAVGQVRDGRFRVTVAVPEGMSPGVQELRIEMSDWFKSSGGLGHPLSFTTKLELVDNIAAVGRGSGKATGGGTGANGPSDGGDIAFVWSDHEQQTDWEKSTVGEVMELEARVVADMRTEYADLAPLGEKKVTVVLLNREYPPFKGYLAGRSKSLSELDRPREAYALGVAVDLLLLHAGQKHREERSNLEPFSDEFLQAAHDAAARAVLAVMPAFDELARQAGLGDGPATEE